MNVLIASDHAGYELKEFLKQFFKTKYSWTDLGTDSKDSVDYPDFADLLAHQIQPNQFGVLICGSGVGVCIRANRYPQVRAVQVWSSEIAKLSREHNDANVICLGERVQKKEDAAQFLEIFLKTQFQGQSSDAAGQRHLRRVSKLSAPIK